MRGTVRDAEPLRELPVWAEEPGALRACPEADVLAGDLRVVAQQGADRGRWQYGHNVVTDATGRSVSCAGGRAGIGADGRRRRSRLNAGLGRYTRKHATRCSTSVAVGPALEGWSECCTASPSRRITSPP